MVIKIVYEQVVEYLWEVRTMEHPDCKTWSKAFHMQRRDTGSIPVVGSSKNTTGGLPIRAMAVLNFLLFPPLQRKINALLYTCILIYFTCVKTYIKKNWIICNRMFCGNKHHTRVPHKVLRILDNSHQLLFHCKFCFI